MAQITGQAGTNLSQQLATYLSVNQGSLTSEQIVDILNSYLTGGDKLTAQGGTINTGIYKRFGEFDQITGKTEVVTTGLFSGDAGSLTTFFTSSMSGSVKLLRFLSFVISLIALTIFLFAASALNETAYFFFKKEIELVI